MEASIFYEKYLRQWVQICDTVINLSQHCPRCHQPLEVQNGMCPFCHWNEEEGEG